MLLIPIRGEFNSLLEDESLFQRPLKEWLTEIDYLNNQTNLSEVESIVHLFLSRAEQIISGIERVSYEPSIALPLWRSLYEIAIIFRVLTQTVNRGQDIKTFAMAVKRFKDYGLIDEYRSAGVELPYELKLLEKEYASLPRELNLNLEYDWLNPVFPKGVLKRCSKPYHPSFRDLIARTQETNITLKSLTEYYQKASTLLHFNFSSQKVLSEVDSERVKGLTATVLCELLSDYLLFVFNIYKDSTNPQIKTIAHRSEFLSKEIPRKY